MSVAAQLAVSQEEVQSLLSDTHAKAQTHLRSAQELSLQRHAIVDDMTELSQQLVSDMTVEERQSTLLEDIEALHRNLKELTSIRSYVQVIKQALTLRYACYILHYQLPPELTLAFDK